MIEKVKGSQQQQMIIYVGREVAAVCLLLCALPPLPLPFPVYLPPSLPTAFPTSLPATGATATAPRILKGHDDPVGKKSEVG